MKTRTRPSYYTDPIAVTSQLDTIIVPTVRSSNHLAYAKELAMKTNSCLIVLCSGGASATETMEGTIDRDLQPIAIDIPAGYNHPLLAGFVTDSFPKALYGRENNDLSLKRNVGLLLGHMVGSRKLLFLDDDIVCLNGFADALATDEAAVGFLMTDFPDNSVVRHAERLGGVEPGVSLSGGALIVNTSRTVGFFPNIYNEDWLFLYNNLLHAAPPTLTNTATQQPYDPYSIPLRAASEEFGDVLAEGIMQLAKSGTDPISASEKDWLQLLAQRKGLIDNIGKRLMKHRGEQNVKAALVALYAARKQLDAIAPKDCTNYMAAWRRDIEEWQKRVTALPEGLSVSQALEELGL